MLATELDVTIERIINRRAQVEDRGRELISDDPRELLAYLRKHRGRNIPDWVQTGDLLDGFTLDNWVWRDDRMRLLDDLRHGRRMGMSLAQLGKPLGITTPQGTQDLIDRLTALRDRGRPDEQLTREARRAARNPPGGAGGSDWVTDHHAALTGLAADLLAQAARWKVSDRDWLDELADDLTHDTWSLGVLNLAVAELRTAPAVLALTGHDTVHKVLHRADQLRTSWSQ